MIEAEWIRHYPNPNHAGWHDGKEVSYRWHMVKSRDKTAYYVHTACGLNIATFGLENSAILDHKPKIKARNICKKCSQIATLAKV